MLASLLKVIDDPLALVAAFYQVCLAWAAYNLMFRLAGGAQGSLMVILAVFGVLFLRLMLIKTKG